LFKNFLLHTKMLNFEWKNFRYKHSFRTNRYLDNIPKWQDDLCYVILECKLIDQDSTEKFLIRFFDINCAKKKSLVWWMNSVWVLNQKPEETDPFLLTTYYSLDPILLLFSLSFRWLELKLCKSGHFWGIKYRWKFCLVVKIISSNFFHGNWG